ncbi:MAG: ABC1 kinase family protein [Candidatus Nanoarchaeia archaeon]
MNLGKKIRVYCENKGLVYVKIGQLLSTRYDILSDEDCKELQKLLDKSKPIPFDVIKKIIEKEYNKPINKLFKRVDETPVASASIAQVHKATLHDGTIVAVKIKRPDIEKTIKKDITFLKFVATMASIYPKFRRLKPRKILDQFHSWILQEIDFDNELKNMLIIQNSFKKYAKPFRPDLGRIEFIAPYEKLCTKNILVTKFIDGTPFSQCHKRDEDTLKSLKTIIVAGIRELFNAEIYYIQADPHPANILIKKNGDVANVDCGLICKLEGKQLKMIRDMFFQVYIKDDDGLVDTIMQFSKSKSLRLENRIRKDVRKYLQKSEKRGIGFWYMGIAKILINNGISIPESFALFGRLNVMLDGLINTYDKNLTTLDILEEEFRIVLKKRTIENIKSTDYLPLMYKLSEKMKKSPEAFEKIIDNPEAYIKQFNVLFSKK